MFRRNISPPYSGSKSKPYKKPENSAACFMMVSYLLTLKPRSFNWYFAPKIRLTFIGRHGVLSQKIDLIAQFHFTGNFRLSPASSGKFSSFSNKFREIFVFLQQVLGKFRLSPASSLILSQNILNMLWSDIFSPFVKLNGRPSFVHTWKWSRIYIVFEPPPPS
jgi:hypothetical protein